MRERPILFSAPMVRALLDGTKTQTRRLVKGLNHEPGAGAVTTRTDGTSLNGCCWDFGGPAIHCPYGQPGDRLWVRETWYCDDYRVQAGPYVEVDGARELLAYRADGERPYESEQPVWKPSIHMPRWASRILLEIVSVRVERLNDCSEGDALAEGIDAGELAERQDSYDIVCKGTGAIGRATAQSMYRELWESINGAGSWAANPWVWVVEFRRVLL